jgi:hypothetical protein
MIKHNWQKLIEQQAASDLLIEDFCKSNGISNSAFYRHKKILSEGKATHKEKSNHIDFARVEVKGKKDNINPSQKPVIQAPTIRLHTPEGYTLEVFI